MFFITGTISFIEFMERLKNLENKIWPTKVSKKKSNEIFHLIISGE